LTCRTYKEPLPSVYYYVQTFEKLQQPETFKAHKVEKPSEIPCIFHYVPTSPMSV